MTDLDKLIEAVESGTAINDDFNDCFDVSPTGNNAIAAYHGSLDAVKALHDALLPGWDVQITDHGAQYEDIGRWHVKVNWQHTQWQTTFTAPGPFGHSAQGNSPARAWLLAILKAYRSLQ